MLCSQTRGVRTTNSCLWFIRTHGSCVSLRFCLSRTHYLSRQGSRDAVVKAEEEWCVQEEKGGGEGDEAQTSRAAAKNKKVLECLDRQLSHINPSPSDASFQRWCVIFYPDHMPPISFLLTFTLFSASDCVFYFLFHKMQKRKQTGNVQGVEWTSNLSTDQSKGDV